MRITDFCLVAAAADPQLRTSILRGESTAPEVLRGGYLPPRHGNDRGTSRTTPWALSHGGVLSNIQIFTRAFPFGCFSSPKAMMQIARGNRPPRPKHPAFAGSLWKLTQRCWVSDPHLLPEASEVCEALHTPSVSFILAIAPINSSVSSLVVSPPPRSD